MSRRIFTALASSLLGAGALLVAAAHAAEPAAAPPGAIQASFDCTTAKAKWQVLVCGDAGLAALDVREAQLLHRARVKAVQPETVEADQDVWTGQRAACSSAACLSRAYRRRIGELLRWTN